MVHLPCWCFWRRGICFLGTGGACSWTDELSTGRAKNAGSVSHQTHVIILSYISPYVLSRVYYMRTQQWCVGNQPFSGLDSFFRALPSVVHSPPGLSTQNRVSICETLNPWTDSNSDAGKTSSIRKDFPAPTALFISFHYLTHSNSTVAHRSSGLKHCQLWKEHRTEEIDQTWLYDYTWLCGYFSVWFPDPAFPHF